jgi:hypothetical protein
MLISLVTFCVLGIFFNFLRSYFSPIIYVVDGRIAIPQLPYKVSCDYVGKFNPPQCLSDKYTCQYSECVLKDQYTPDGISCWGNIGHTQREIALCKSDEYICNSNIGFPDGAVECIKK